MVAGNYKVQGTRIIGFAFGSLPTIKVLLGVQRWQMKKN